MKGRRPERAGESRDSAPRYGARTAEARDTHAFSGRQLADYPVLIEFLLCVELAALRTAHAQGRITSDQLSVLTKGCNDALKGASDDFICEVLQARGESAWITNVREVVDASVGTSSGVNLHAIISDPEDGADLALGSIAGRLALNAVAQRAIAALDETVDLLRFCAPGFEGEVTPPTWERHADDLASELRELDGALGDLRFSLVDPSNPDAVEAAFVETFSTQLRELCINPITIHETPDRSSSDLERIAECAERITARLLSIQRDTRRSERVGGAPNELDSLAPCCVQVHGAVDAARRWLTAEHRLGSEAGTLINLYEAVEMLKEGVFKFNTQILAPASLWSADEETDSQ